MIDFADLREVPQDQAMTWLETLSGNLRPTDLDEIRATSDLPPFNALVSACLVSDHAWVGLHEGVPVLVFGCGPTGVPDSGMVWMMGSPEMDRPGLALAILRKTRPYLDQMHRAYALLWNYIDARNDKSMSWLSWAGFKLTDVIPEHGREKRLFITFARYHPNV